MLSDQPLPYATRRSIDWEARALELEEDNRQLRAAMGGVVSADFTQRCKQVLDIPVSQSRLLAILMAGKTRSIEGIWLAYCRPAASRPDIGIVKVQISHLRKALAPHGISIDTVWGVGHSLSEPMRERVRCVLGMEAAAQ